METQTYSDMDVDRWKLKVFCQDVDRFDKTFEGALKCKPVVTGDNGSEWRRQIFP